VTGRQASNVQKWQTEQTVSSRQE